jgi:hypothetical protein
VVHRQDMLAVVAVAHLLRVVEALPLVVVAQVD